MAEDTIKVKFVGDVSGLTSELQKAQEAIAKLNQDSKLSGGTGGLGDGDTGGTGGNGGGNGGTFTMEADPELKKQLTALLRRMSALTNAINKPPDNPSGNTWGDEKDFERRRGYEEEQQKGILERGQREIRLLDARERREAEQAERDKKFDERRLARMDRDETRQANALTAEEQRRQRQELRNIANERKRLAAEQRYWDKQIELLERRDARENDEYERRKRRDEEYESKRKENEEKRKETETKRKEEEAKRETEQNQIRRYTQAINAVNAIGRVFRAFGALARASGNNESLAYRVFGRTSEYTNYDAVRRTAGIAGAHFGYDTETVLNAADANIQRAGFESDEAYQADINSILGTAKVYGMNTSDVASVSGRAVALGTVEIGNQSEFADILSQSILDAGMTGRESEQLSVLEGILEVLQDTNATVSRETALSGLSLYNFIANTNENMRGERGSELASGMIGLAQSKNMSLDILAGFGTRYTGLQGRLALSELAESDPEQYYRQVAEGWRYRFGNDKDEYLIYFLSNRLGSVAKARTIVENLDSLQSGEYSIDETDEGRERRDELLSEYDKTGLNTREEAEAKAELAGENAGHGLNAIARPFQAIYNNLSGGARTALAVGGTLAGALAPSIAVSIGARGINNTINAIRAGGSGILGGFGRITGLGGGAGRFGLNPSALTRTGLVIGSVAEAASTVLDDIEAAQEGDTRRVFTRTGQGVGRIGGMVGGAKLGAMAGTAILPGIGTAIGAGIGSIGGYIAGGYLGGGAGGVSYDATHNGGSYSFTDEQYNQLQKYAANVRELYETQGNNAAQDYTKRTVAPWLESIGVSKSITSRYNTDVWKPDFLSDFDRGRFKTSETLAQEESVREARKEATSGRTGTIGEAVTRSKDIGTIGSHWETVEDENGGYQRVLSSNTTAVDSNTNELYKLNVNIQKFSIDGAPTTHPLQDGIEFTYGNPINFNFADTSRIGTQTPGVYNPNVPVKTPESFYQTDLDVLAGFGTKYTGINGMTILRYLEANQPEAYYGKIASGWTEKYGTEYDDQLSDILSSRLGSTVTARRVIEEARSGGFTGDAMQLPAQTPVREREKADNRGLTENSPQITPQTPVREDTEDRGITSDVGMSDVKDELSDVNDKLSDIRNELSVLQPKFDISEQLSGAAAIKSASGTNSATVTTSGLKSTGIATPITGTGKYVNAINNILSRVTYYQPSTTTYQPSSVTTGYGVSTNAVGKEYVPYNDYPALLHKGEMVLREDEADDYRYGKMPEWRNPLDEESKPSVILSDNTTTERFDGNFNLNVNVSGSIDGMTQGNQQVIVSAVLAQLQSSGLRQMLGNSWTRIQNK